MNQSTKIAPPNSWIRFKGLCIGLTIAVLAAFLIAVLRPGALEREYYNSVATNRTNIDNFMTYSDQSPIKDDELADFAGLRYFDIDPSFRTSGGLELFAIAEIIEVPTSADTFDRYLRYAIFRFELKGREFELEVWKSLEGQVTNRL